MTVRRPQPAVLANQLRALAKLIDDNGTRVRTMAAILAARGWPLVGDKTYGHKPRTELLADVASTMGRQALHAATLSFEHPARYVGLSYFRPGCPQENGAGKCASRSTHRTRGDGRWSVGNSLSQRVSRDV